MIPVLKRISLAFITFCVSCFYSISAFAQSAVKLTDGDTGAQRVAQTAVANPTGEELHSLGAQGQMIEQARDAVSSILSADNACSAWFRSAEPQALEKFLSLRFVVDFAGASEIRKPETGIGDAKYYQPYVARARQDVGPGSTVTLNANGAFFKNAAVVRAINGTGSLGYIQSFRHLAIGPYSGATLQARTLAMLHEYGHVLNMLPIDAGLPFVSMQNTETVMMHCMRRIQAEVKHSRSATTASLPMQTYLASQSTPNHSQAVRQRRTWLHVSGGESLLPPRFD